MSTADDPSKKPPPQPTVAWNPDEVPGLDRGPAAAPPKPSSPNPAPQPTVAWNPDDVPGLGSGSTLGEGPGSPVGPQATVAWNPDDVPGLSGGTRDDASGPPANANPAANVASSATPSPAAEGTEEDPLIGTLLRGKWRVLKRLGAGSFGTVYKVRDEKGGWVEALKILGVDRLTGADAENMRKRFLREAQIMKRLGTASPHIVGLSTYEEDIEAGLIYFLMELVEGKSLADALRDEGPFDPARIVRLGLQVCDALMAAHEGPESVVHRDLKLENLMLTKDRAGEESVKVLDFGIAKIAEREADSRLTTVGTLGTPGYAAPEQLRAEEVDGRTDLFAFGVILYALLTGRDPWLGHLAYQPTHQIYELMVATDRGEVRPMSRPDGEIPPALVTVVMRLLRRDPAERFQSAKELRDALLRIEAGGTEGAVGSLRVLTDAPGVRVEIRSGRQVLASGPTPRVANGLAAGSYRIAVVDPRFEPVETSVTLGAGAMEDVTVVTRPRATGVGAAARRRPVAWIAAVVALLAAGAVGVIRPWGRTLALDAVEATAQGGGIRQAWLTEDGLHGLVAVGPFSAPFHVPLSAEEADVAIERVRGAGVDVDTSWEVARLTTLAAEAQARLEYFGEAGTDVRSYAARIAALAPESPEARSLFLKVGERLAWEADAASAAGDVTRARALLEECLTLVPRHPRCNAVSGSL